MKTTFIDNSISKPIRSIRINSNFHSRVRYCFIIFESLDVDIAIALATSNITSGFCCFFFILLFVCLFRCCCVYMCPDPYSWSNITSIRTWLCYLLSLFFFFLIVTFKFVCAFDKWNIISSTWSIVSTIKESTQNDLSSNSNDLCNSNKLEQIDIFMHKDTETTNKVNKIINRSSKMCLLWGQQLLWTPNIILYTCNIFFVCFQRGARSIYKRPYLQKTLRFSLLFCLFALLWSLLVSFWTWVLTLVLINKD
jgi:hypothetical protein